MEQERTYVCIDLKSFYASVECVARGLDPMTTKLVVADPTRSEMTICLAVSPAMKAAGVRNRCRLHEIPKGMEFITARPRMRAYMAASADIYGVYLRYVSPDDIHPYSIDECFIDATPYLELYAVDARGFANTLRDAVRAETGIPATVGIGPNPFLAKVALEVEPDVLYGEFGVNAEYLIDHAWGLEPCTIAEIKAYEPETSSLMNGQILPCGYSFDDTLVVLREMVDDTVLDLVDKHLVTDHISLHVSYKRDAQRDGEAAGELFEGGHGLRRADGRSGPHGGGSRNIPERTNSFAKLFRYVEALFRETVDPTRTMRKISVGFGNLVDEDLATVDLFTDMEAAARERRRQETVLAVKGKFGKNALIKGTSLKERALGRERNEMVGGHHG